MPFLLALAVCFASGAWGQILQTSVSSIAFGNPVTKGTPGTTTFTVTNSGGGTLSVSNITSSNSQFTASPTSFNLASGTSQTVTVTFAPAKVGWEKSALMIAHSAAGSPATVTASGIGRVNPQTGSLTNTRIAYMSNLGLNLRGTLGGGETALGVSMGSRPSWSPDGTRIVYSANSTLAILDLVTGANTPLLSSSAGGEPRNPVWSPDGTRIAFYSSWGIERTSGIYTVGLDGGSMTRVIDHGMSPHEVIDWSPDGSKLVFSGLRGSEQSVEIWTVDAAGSNLAQVTNNSAYDANPVWSPDGTGIAFYSKRDGNEEVYVMKADGSEQTRLTNNTSEDADPSWSPDGSKIAFYSSRDGDGEIYVMKADGSEQTNLTNHSGSFDDNPDWSPFPALIPIIHLPSGPLSFGDIDVGDSGPMVFTIDNRGYAPLEISQISMEGSDGQQFQIVPSTASIAANSSRAFTITFAPSSGGVKSASISMVHNAPGTPAVISLSGTGVDVSGVFLSDSTINLDNTGVGSTSQKMFSIANRSRTDRTISNISITGVGASQFTVSPATATVLARSNQTFTVTFSPTSPGTKTATLSIAHSGTGSPSLISLTGTNFSTAQAEQIASQLNPEEKIWLWIARQFGVGWLSDYQLGEVNRSLASRNMSLSPKYVQTSIDRGILAKTNNLGDYDITEFGQAVIGRIPGVDANLNDQRLLGFSLPPPTPLPLTGNTQSAITDEDSPRQITLSATNPTGRSLSFSIVTQPTKGTVTLNGATANYTPTANANGSDSFTFTANDGQATSAPATVSITINSVNDPPALSSIGNRSVSIGQNVSIRLSASDVDGDPLGYSATGLPSGAVLSGPTFSWTPTQAGTFPIAFSVSDGKGGSQGETVQITVTAVVPAGPADAVASPSAWDFGDQTSASPTERTFYVKNPGANQVNLTGLTVDTPVFAVLSPTLPRIVGAGDSVAVVVRFTPPVNSGDRQQGTLTLSSSAGAKAVTLSGRRIWVGLVIRPDTLDFGSTPVGSSVSRTFTVSNPGNLRLEITSTAISNGAFSVDARTFNVEGGSSREVRVTYTPQQEGRQSGTLTLSGNTDSAVAVRVTGTSAMARMSVGSGVDLGSVSVGAQASRLLAIKSVGTDTLRVTTLTGLQVPFSQSTSGPLRLAPGDSSLVQLGFAPTSNGTFRDTLVVASDGGKAEVVLTGKGVQATLSLDDRLDFGNVQLGATASLALVFRNTGSDTLRVTNILSNKPSFQVGAATLAIPPGDIRDISLRFAPTRSGQETATLSVATNIGIFLVQLSGVGQGVETVVQGPIVAFDVDTLKFVDAAINTTAQDSVELLNDGGDTLRVERVRVVPPSPGFTLIRNPRGFTVAPGESKFIAVTFRPRAAGTFTGILEVRSNAVGSPHRLPLLGKTPELSPKLVLVPEDTLRFGSVGQGQDDIRPLTIRNEGQGILEVSLTSDRADFVPERDTVRVEAGQSRQVQIRFRPTQPGTRTGRLRVRSNDRQRETLFVGMRGFSGNLRFEPVSIDYGEVPIGAQRDTTVVLINETADAATLVLDAFGAGFSVDPRSAVVDAGQRLSVRVRFSPSSLGDFTGKVELRDRDVELVVFGKGVDVKIKAPAGLRASLDGSRVNLSWNLNTEPGLSHYVVYRNPQDNFEPTRADSIGRTGKSAPRLTDRPPGSGAFYYRVVAVDNQGNRSEPSETVEVQLASAPTVADVAIVFGEVVVGGTKELATLVTNPGPGTLTITNIAATGRDNDQFRPTQRTASIPAGQSKEIRVAFSPRTAGPKTAVLNITHDKGAPLTVSLSGTATAVLANPLRVVPTTLSFDNTQVGTPATKTLRLVNSGNSILSLKLEISGTNRTLFRLSRTQLQVRAQNEAQVRVIFDPKTAGTKRATLVISPASGNAFSRIEVPLSGSVVAARGLSEEVVDLAKVVGAQALQPALGDNYPNPFNAQTLIPYQLAAPGWVKLAVYDMLGQRVHTLVEGTQEAGAYQATWDSRSELGNAVASGIYFVRLEAGPFSAVQKVVLLR